MPTELITLNSPSGRLDALSEGTRAWARVSQICDTLGINRATFYRIIERDPSVVTEGHTMLLPWPSEGGEQPTRVYSLDAVLNIAMEVNNRRARKLRRWLVAIIRGQAPVPRVAADPLARLPEARATLAHPMMRAALAKLEEAEAVRAAAMRSHQQRMTEAGRLARMAGLSTRDLYKFRQLERLLTELPDTAPPQHSLPLDA
jgi:prophage antirepressor-like protein